MADDYSAIMEADEVDTGVDEGTVDTADAGTTSEPVLAETQTEAVDTKTDWRKVPAELKEFFKTPAGKPAADAWFARAGWHEKFPGGTKEADEILGFLNEHGGRDGLANALQDFTAKAQELDTIQERIANADPALLSDLPPESIGKLGPAFLAEYSKADFDGYNAQLSGVFAQTIAQAGIPMDLEKTEFYMSALSESIIAAGQQDNAQLVRAFKSIEAQLGKFKEFTGSFAKIAATPVQPKADTSKLDTREQSIKAQEAKMQSEQFNADVERFKVPLIETELKSWIAKSPGDEEKRDAAVSMLRDRVSQALNKEHQEKGKSSTAGQVLALLTKGDKANALRIAQSRETALIRELAPKVGRIIYGTAEAPKGAAVTTKQATSVVRATPRPQVAGRFEDRLAAIWDS